jgi:tetratricopeptide (TPR) repeat protein
MPAPAIPFRVPYARNPLFQGRETELAALFAALPAGPTPAITGTGGLGKTQLAVEVAYRVWEQEVFPGGVFWLSMEQPESVAAQVAACAGPEGLDLPGWEPGAFERNVAAVRAAWQAPIARLLVFDNLEDPALLSAWRPRVGGCRVLITTRNAQWPAALGVRALPLAPLARAASQGLLLAPRAAAQGTTVAALLADPATTYAADAICATLGDLPLALALAAAYLESMPGASLERYLTQVRGDLLAHRSLSPPPGTDLPTGHTPSLGVTFALSYLRLEPAHPGDALALTLLHRAAHCAPAPIPRRLLARAAGLAPDDPETAEPLDLALARLAGLGLIERLPDGALRLHRLLAAYVRDRAPDPAADQTAVEEALADEANAANQAGYPLAGLPYLEHLRHAAQLAAPRRDRRASTLFNNLAGMLYSQGDLAAAQPLYERALQLNEGLYGPDHPDVALALNNLALLARAQGDYGTAHALLQRARAIAERLGDPTHQALAYTLHNLGLLLYNQGDFAAARPVLEQVLALNEARYGPAHGVVATDLSNLAGVLQEQGAFAAARPLMERALAIRRQQLGAVHPETAASLGNLASLARSEGDLPGARALAEQALAVFEQTLGPQHPTIALSLTNLAALLHDQGELTAARPLYERALAIREQALGPAHPETARSLTNLGRLLQSQGDYAGARSLLERALAIQAQALGPAHPSLAVSLESLGSLLFAEGDYAGAQHFMERVLAMREQMLGPEHPDTASSLSNVATLRHIQGDLPGARPLYERALAIQEQVVGPDHPDTANSLNNLARLLVDEGDVAGARALLTRALAIHARVYGPNHPATAKTRANLASLEPPPPRAPDTQKWSK